MVLLLACRKINMKKNIFHLLFCSAFTHLKTLCTTSHLHLHTYVHTLVAWLQGATFPSWATQGWVTAFTCTPVQSDNTIPLLRMVGELSLLKVYRGDNQPLATAVWPLASWLTCHETASRKASLVVLSHAAQFVAGQSQVSRYWSQSTFSCSNWRSLNTLQEKSEYDRFFLRFGDVPFVGWFWSLHAS